MLLLTIVDFFYLLLINMGKKQTTLLHMFAKIPLQRFSELVWVLSLKTNSIKKLLFKTPLGYEQVGGSIFSATIPRHSFMLVQMDETSRFPKFFLTPYVKSKKHDEIIISFCEN